MCQAQVKLSLKLRLRFGLGLGLRLGSRLRLGLRLGFGSRCSSVFLLFRVGGIILQAEIEDQGILIQIDGNLHAGSTLIKNDPNPQNQNGKIFMDFLQRNSTMSVVNPMSICQGTITRHRILESRSERAVLDFFIVNEKLSPFLTKMIVDEERDYSLGNYSQYHKNNRLIETDHNGLILELKLEYSAQKPERREYFNFRNKVCQGEFKKETEINSQLLECFENQLSVEMQCKKWLKTFNSIVYKCFRKI